MKNTKTLTPLQQTILVLLRFLIGWHLLYEGIVKLLNGVLAVDTIDDMSASGFLGFQFHKAYRKWQVDKRVLWKNIKIKEL